MSYNEQKNEWLVNNTTEGKSTTNVLIGTVLGMEKGKGEWMR
jgi:hypothetical protein